MSSEEYAVQYWGKYDDDGDEGFWVKDAMTAALGILWYNHYRHSSMPDVVHLTLDRERGVVTASARA